MEKDEIQKDEAENSKKTKEIPDDDPKLIAEAAIYRDQFNERHAYYMHPNYDSSESRRVYRDRYLKHVIEMLLISAEWKRDYSNSDDMQMFWTAEELFVACQDIWIRSQGSRFYPAAFYRGTLEYLRNQFLDNTTKWWNWCPKWHFVQYDGYDVPTEDRIVPFDIHDVRRILTEMRNVEEVLTPSRLHWSIDKRNLTPEFKQDWIGTIKKPNRPLTSDEMFALIFHPNPKDFPDKFAFNLRHCPDIVPYALFGAEGDTIWHLSKPTKPARETSTPGKAHISNASRIVHEKTGYYGTPDVNDMLTKDERPLRMQGMNYFGPSPIAGTYFKFWEYLMTRQTPDTEIKGYRLKTLPPEPQYPQSEAMPLFDVQFCPSGDYCRSTRDLISRYLRINPAHEAHMDENYEACDKVCKELEAERQESKEEKKEEDQ